MRQRGGAWGRGEGGRGAADVKWLFEMEGRDEGLEGTEGYQRRRLTHEGNRLREGGRGEGREVEGRE